MSVVVECVPRAAGSLILGLSRARRVQWFSYETDSRI